MNSAGPLVNTIMHTTLTAHSPLHTGDFAQDPNGACSRPTTTALAFLPDHLQRLVGQRSAARSETELFTFDAAVAGAHLAARARRNAAGDLAGQHRRRADITVKNAQDARR